MQEELLERMTNAGYYRYAARAECFMDVIRAFKIIDDYNKYKEGHHIIRIISPTIKGSFMSDTDFDFYTNEAPHTLQTLWDTQGTDLHRIIQTIKRFDEYDGKTDLSFWAEEEDEEEEPPACQTCKKPCWSNNDGWQMIHGCVVCQDCFDEHEKEYALEKKINLTVGA